ncbi:hypothetical protein OG897_35440 [Streptomyces sp. NBC_00237]|uniref:hypothetical protein n=1 Tax=Streptomyces sp. NBC_00237 TaxID=2975687 RepID=UPI0022582612|nr:hypothetical protein [Streptomyces sp. NBC_00237]MCX5206685.1 hypothetical protein [Streptomyces sp. NBC_00237]
MNTAPITGLPLIDFYVLTDQVAQALGDSWDKDDTTADADDQETVRFAHTDGRTIDIRRQFRGQGFQTFSTNPDAPRYHASGYFDGATPPLDTVMHTLEIHLFPAFYGHRLPLTQGGARILPQPVAADTPAPPAEPAAPAAPVSESAPVTAPAAEPAPVKAPAKKPAVRKAAPKKSAPAAPRKKAAARTTTAKPTTKAKAPARGKAKDPAPAA